MRNLNALKRNSIHGAEREIMKPPASIHAIKDCKSLKIKSWTHHKRIFACDVSDIFYLNRGVLFFTFHI